MTSGADMTPIRLELGSNVVQLLIPQRWPMLMVDRLERVTGGPTPVLEASRMISAGDIVFQGHFPDLHLWPGCLTIEGMGQTSALLSALLAVRERMERVAGDGQAAFAALRNLERGYRLSPGFDALAAARFREQVHGLPDRLSVGASVDVRLRQPVFAGQRMDYRSRLLLVVGDMMRFEVEAEVDGVVVAEGTMTGARVLRARPEGTSPA